MTELRARTVFDSAELERFGRYQIGHQKKLWVLLGFFELMFLLRTLGHIANEGFDSTAFSYILTMCLLGGAFVAALLLGPRVASKKSELLGAVCELEFREDGFQSTLRSETLSDDAFVRYGSLYRVAETERNIYLFISARNAYVVDKTCFLAGDTDGLRTLLREKVGAEKFKK